MEYDFLFKILIIGDSGVGKSCLLTRYTDGYYESSFISTIGVDFKIQTLEIDGKTVKLQIWDTAGQDRFRSITSSYYRGSHAVLLCYDVSEPDTFRSLSSWMMDVEKYTSEGTYQILVGCKSDLPQKVTLSTIEQFAQPLGLKWVETSAKDNTNIQSTFRDLASDLVTKHRNKARSNGRVDLQYLVQIERKSTCC